MTNMVAGRVVSSVVQRQVKYLTTVRPDDATGPVAEIYDQVADEMRIVVPPAVLHSPRPDLLAAYWMLVREPLVLTGTVDRLAKEAIATAVSVANICPYCVDMHSVGIYDLGTEDDAEALVADRAGDVEDPHVRAVAAWARVADRPDHPLVADPPFPPAARPETVGMVVSLHYLNRLVNVFLSSFLLPPRLSPRTRRRLKQGISHVLGPTLRGPHEPGRSLRFRPDAPVPESAAWAAGSPAIQSAVARAYRAFADAGARSVPDGVRELVHERLATWRGEEAGLSRQWCEDLIERLPAGERPVGRLALLTAFASYQVDDDVIDDVRRVGPDGDGADGRLLDVAAWAAYVAAERIGTWHRGRIG
jgi:AhpD family alkylhydroperoxidase